MVVAGILWGALLAAAGYVVELLVDIVGELRTVADEIPNVAAGEDPPRRRRARPEYDDNGLPIR